MAFSETPATMARKASRWSRHWQALKLYHHRWIEMGFATSRLLGCVFRRFRLGREFQEVAIALHMSASPGGWEFTPSQPGLQPPVCAEGISSLQTFLLLAIVPGYPCELIKPRRLYPRRPYTTHSAPNGFSEPSPRVYNKSLQRSHRTNVSSMRGVDLPRFVLCHLKRWELRRIRKTWACSVNMLQARTQSLIIATSAFTWFCLRGSRSKPPKWNRDR